MPKVRWEICCLYLALRLVEKLCPATYRLVFKPQGIWSEDGVLIQVQLCQTIHQHWELFSTTITTSLTVAKKTPGLCGTIFYSLWRTLLKKKKKHQQLQFIKATFYLTLCCEETKTTHGIKIILLDMNIFDHFKPIIDAGSTLFAATHLISMDEIIKILESQSKALIR